MEQPPTTGAASATTAIATSSQAVDPPTQPPQPQPTPTPASQPPQPPSSLPAPSSAIPSAIPPSPIPIPNPNPNPSAIPNQNPNSKLSTSTSTSTTSSLPPQNLPSLHKQRRHPGLLPHSPEPCHTNSSSSSSPTFRISLPFLLRHLPHLRLGPPRSLHRLRGEALPLVFRRTTPARLHNPRLSRPLSARPTMQGGQGMGMLGSLGSSSSQIRPGGIPAHHQQRPVQSSLRPPSSPTSQPSTSQNLQGHGLLRLSSVGSPGSSSPNASQSMHSVNQPWLSSASQGKPPLPSPSNRHQVNLSIQQRAHLPQQQHHLVPTTSQQQPMSTLQQPQPSPSNPSPENYAQQFAPSRILQSVSHQQQITRVQGAGNQKTSSLATVQPNTVQFGAQSRTAIANTDESCNRILSKRSIHELVSQVDPLEKLDPEVEDILVDIAEDFVDSITTFGCSLAKHRKSTTLEAKDILLHLEKNWNMTLPGFGGDEIKSYRKPVTNDIHKERLAAIKKSIVATETATKVSAGQAAGNAKGNLAKTPANALAPQT
ncbi:Transcription initiation factor TFIID subunit 12 [Morella rubra]|uniref:Transcription initiation factor TFIID subunit 12 n=1 Tax=Morella rubra TaxID=262757 RepID=A0A6A1W7W3_9ROSI|nr:Transcription initiation factor TFIID subunit 12 [Morella rubra]